MKIMHMQFFNIKTYSYELANIEITILEKKKKEKKDILIYFIIIII
jgi:hypothetical protein